MCGKIRNIYKTAGTISYTYNPAGQRVSKTAAGLTTWYVRDAQGNPLAVYDNAHGNLNWKEQQLYGSSRLGMWTPNVSLKTNNAIAVWDTIGGKQYELDNHLGNVLATVTDKRLQHTTNTTSIDYYNADVSTAQDYYPGGMSMPGRTYAVNGSNYRYSFNGKEDDRDINIGAQDYGARIYDKRVVRFLSADPIASSYPELTPYQFGSNNPIANIDMDGLEGKNATTKKAFLNPPPLLTPPLVSPPIVPLGSLVEEPLIEQIPKVVIAVPMLILTAILKAIPVPTDGHNEEMAERRNHDGDMIRNNHEIFTDNPSTLPDIYLSQVRERIAMGKQLPSDHKYAAEAARRFGGITVADVKPGRGVIYLRIDKTGKMKPYIGQAKSLGHYDVRQKAHNKNMSILFLSTILLILAHRERI